MARRGGNGHFRRTRMSRNSNGGRTRCIDAALSSGYMHSRDSLNEIRPFLESEDDKAEIKRLNDTMNDNSSQILSDFKCSECGRVDRLLLREACKFYSSEFPDFLRYKSFSREVNILLFQRDNKPKVSADFITVEKEFIVRCWKIWNLEIDSKEYRWRIQNFDTADEKLNCLLSVAVAFRLKTIQMQWDSEIGKQYFYLCKAAAYGNETFHCNIKSPELKIDVRADNGEFSFEKQHLTDAVKELKRVS